MSFMGSMLGGIVGRAALPIMGAASFGAYKSGALDGMPIPGMPTAPAHHEMQARVTTVENACRLRYRDNGKLRQTEIIECDRAVTMLQNPDFQSYTLHKSERIKYSYYSMDGNSTLVGTLDKIRATDGRPYRLNDIITIRVDADDHSISEVI